MDQVNFFKCLSDETRLNIVTLIAENKELCVC
ncbi:transcriptional regulator, partial [Acinetobacter baumannii]